MVGESHYWPDKPEFTAERRKSEEQNRIFTREIVWECPIFNDWPNQTLRRIPRIFLGTTNHNPFEFWQHLAFYNFVQRFMYFTNPPERPTGDDFVLGWQVFLEVARLLKPEHCVFLGSASSHSLSHAMSTLGVQHVPSARAERIGRCWSYKAEIALEGKMLPILFTQHPGKYFNSTNWHSYLAREFPDVITKLKCAAIG
jgi:hypothetical protein